MTLILGLIVSIPVIIIAGPLFALTLKKYKNKPIEIFNTGQIPDDQLPSLFTSISAAFMPVFLIAFHTVTTLIVKEPNSFTRVINGLGDPVNAMVITLLYALYALGLKQKKSMSSLMSSLADAVKKDISMILLIVGGAGGLKQILTDAGISGQIADMLHHMNIHPLLAAWLIAAIIRVCIGSATVAGLTAAGIIAPIVATSGVNPSLMVLATGAGSLMFSHVNDGGFWLFKEYYNMSIKQTLKTWSLMETVVSVTGIIIILY